MSDAGLDSRGAVRQRDSRSPPSPLHRLRCFRDGVHAPDLKVLYLAVRDLEDYRRPNVGIRSNGWKQALQAFTIYFDGRIPTP